MAVSRCPACKVLVTDEEQGSGLCPVCQAPLAGRPAPSAKAAPEPPRQGKPLGWLHWALALVCLAAAALYLWPGVRAVLSPVRPDDPGFTNSPAEPPAQRQPDLKEGP